MLLCALARTPTYLHYTHSGSCKTSMKQGSSKDQCRHFKREQSDSKTSLQDPVYESLVDLLLRLLRSFLITLFLPLLIENADRKIWDLWLCLLSSKPQEYAHKYRVPKHDIRFTMSLCGHPQQYIMRLSAECQASTKQTSSKQSCEKVASKSFLRASMGSAVPCCPSERDLVLLRRQLHDSFFVTLFLLSFQNDKIQDSCLLSSFEKVSAQVHASKNRVYSRHAPFKKDPEDHVVFFPASCEVPSRPLSRN